MVGAVQVHDTRLDQARQPRQRLGSLGLQLGAEGAGQGAHLLGDHEITAHETLDIRFALAVDKAHASRHFGLEIEGQTLLAAPGGGVHDDADLPQEIKGAHEDAPLLVGQDQIEHFRILARAAGQEFGDPVERVQVAQAPLPSLTLGSTTKRVAPLLM